jgi:type IV pilus biogenesis protein CpaD/CtpE
MTARFGMFALTGLGLLLAGCDMYQEGHLSQNRIQVSEERFSQEVATSDLDSEYIMALGDQYARNGDGPVEVAITYDPKSSSNTAMEASNEVVRISRALRAQGITDLNATILPVNGQGEESQTLISYNAYSALAPEDCTVMEGVESTEVTLDPEYKLGCTIDTVFARQIARPKDLKGQEQTDPTTDGRSAANIIEGYRSGVQNEALEGENASE